MSEEKTNDGIEEYGHSIIKDDEVTIYLISIIGEIEGHECLPSNSKTTKYEHVMPLLAAVEESDEIEALLVLLNTVGGDVEAGLAIAELIAGMTKPTVSIVLGGSHSIGIPLAAGVLVPLGIALPPAFGALAMSISSVCVVSNALRLRRFH